MDKQTAARVARLLRRNNFTETDIKYITHHNQKTTFALVDGREIHTQIPLKRAAECFDPEEFWSIQKGIVVAKRYIVSIDDNGVYTMIDEVRFQGRGRNPAEHKRRRRQLNQADNLPLSVIRSKEIGLLEKCDLMQNAPFAFCLIELVFDPNGNGMDFCFRYCNDMILKQSGLQEDDIVGHSFYEVFPDISRNRCVSFLDTAMNGTSHVVKEVATNTKQDLNVYCFQPATDFCACMLMGNDAAAK